jgi:hypothetical protein
MMAKTSVRLVPRDLLDVKYHSGLLLSVSLPASITSDPEYSIACQDGFDGYFEMMYKAVDDGFVFVDHFYTSQDVIDFVLNNIADSGGHLSWSTGFIHGWLSALAPTDYALAQSGVQILSRLVLLCISLQKNRESCLLVA